VAVDKGGVLVVVAVDQEVVAVGQEDRLSSEVGCLISAYKFNEILFKGV